MSPKSQPEVVIRRARPEDSAVCGQLCYAAFSTINAEHGFPCDFPNADVAMHVISTVFSMPEFYCVVAEAEGRIVGSNCLDERAAINGVGPITVDPATQNHGVGRKLMQAVLDRAKERNAPGVRLVQAAFHNRSFSLYASLGFDVREQLACVQGEPKERTIPGCAVRQAGLGDVEACNAVSRRVHGYDRGTELAQAVERGTAKVVERAGRITGYATDLAFFGHGTAETTPDLQALIASAESFHGPGVLIPASNGALLRWCLGNRLRVVQLMTLMSMGLYNEPSGAWFPSISM